MIARVSRLSQILIAAMVTACLILEGIASYGPNIDGETPSLAATIQLVAIVAFIILAFVLAAVGLIRRHKLGWWLSVVLDGLLALAAIGMIAGDVNVRYLITQEGRNAFRGDLAIHGGVLLLCMGAIGFLLLARKQFLMNQAN